MKRAEYTCPNCRQAVSSKTDHVADFTQDGQTALWSCEKQRPMRTLAEALVAAFMAAEEGNDMLVFLTDDDEYVVAQHRTEELVDFPIVAQVFNHTPKDYRLPPQNT